MEETWSDHKIFSAIAGSEYLTKVNVLTRCLKQSNSYEMTLDSWFGLSGTTCVVAGAEGLIGKSITAALRAAGADVISLDPNAPDSDSRIDITDDLSLDGFFTNLRTVRKKASGVSNWAFVNCSYPRTPNWGTLDFENCTEQDWNRNVELHMGSAFRFSRKAVEFLKDCGGGSLINFGSIYGVVGPDHGLYEGTSMKNPAAYAAIKAGIIGLTRYVATTYGPKNIRANVICPGGIENKQPDSFVSAYEKRTPLGRMGRPDDIAGAVAFLVGPSGRYITGQTLVIDGGWTAW